MVEPKQIQQLLEWYALAGVDETIGEAPVNRYAAEPSPPTARSTPPPSKPAVVAETPAPAPPPAKAPAPGAALLTSPSDAAWSAQELAAACESLEALAETVRAFDGCALKKTATNTVIGDGPANAALMFVGEAPGAEEDRQGVPFVGPAGKLLDRMLAAIGLSRPEVYITNMLPWRPPGNRTPTAEELTMCQPFLERQIELVNPRILILIGGISAKAILNRREGITRLRGKWYDYATPRMSKPVQTTAMFHPAYLLRQASAKREAWRDLLDIEERIKAGS